METSGTPPIRAGYVQAEDGTWQPLTGGSDRYPLPALLRSLSDCTSRTLMGHGYRGMGARRLRMGLMASRLSRVI